MKEDNVFDNTPFGYKRANKGWVVPVKTPQTTKTNRALEENKELKERLAILEEAVAGLTTTKRGKKSG